MFLLEPTFKQVDSEPKYEPAEDVFSPPENWAENSQLSGRLGEEQILQRRNDEIKIEDISTDEIKKARDILPSSDALKSGTWLIIFYLVLQAHSALKLEKKCNFKSTKNTLFAFSKMAKNHFLH